MTNDDDVVGRIAEQYVDFLDGKAAAAPELEGLEPPLRQHATAVCDALRVAWHSGLMAPPPLDEDPLAISLGLVPDPSRALDGNALRTARTRAKLRPSDLRDRLAERGWTVRTAELARWEQEAHVTIMPAVIKAMAEELSVPESRLVARTPASPPDPRVEAMTASSRFQSLAQRWAALFSLGEPDAVAALRQVVMSGAALRGEQPSQDAWLDAIEVLVAAQEGRRR